MQTAFNKQKKLMYDSFVQSHGVDATYKRGEISVPLKACPTANGIDAIQFGGTVYDGFCSFLMLSENLKIAGISIPEDRDEIIVDGKTYTVSKTSSGPCWVMVGNDDTMIRVYTRGER